MVKTKVNWTSSTGEQFIFEYNVTRDRDASSVRNVNGTIHHISSAGSGDEKIASTGPKAKKQKGEEVVGYLKGYEIRRGANGNKNFHDHAACANSELQDFACALYDHKGMMCRAPRNSPITDIYWMDGSMFLVELMEIKQKFSGNDLGINFLHEYLSQPDVARRVGVVVMKPWTISRFTLRYEDNIQRVERSWEGKSESEKVDVNRDNTVKLRRQFSRMGFAVVADTPDWVDKWFMSMEKYRTMKPDDVKKTWQSKEAASQLPIPMPEKKYVKTEVDKELEKLLKGIMPDFDPNPAMTSRLEQQVAGLKQQMEEMRQQLTSLTGGASVPSLDNAINSLGEHTGSKLTDAKRQEIRRLVDAGANLYGINALHLAAAQYKNEDLFDLLINEYEMDMEAFDHIGLPALHVAACTNNVDGLRILIEKGADKNSLNRDGKTALDEVNEVGRNISDFGRSMWGAPGGMMGGSEYVQIRRLLN